jgi:hypothetical protein
MNADCQFIKELLSNLAVLGRTIKKEKLNAVIV